MIKLNGAEKQNKWAQDIIDDAFNTINGNIEHAKKENERCGKDILGPRILAFERIKKEFETMLKMIEEKQDNTAEYIIEHRERISPQIILRFATEYEEKIRNERRDNG